MKTDMPKKPDQFKTIDKVFLYAMEEEKEARDFYLESSKKIDDPEIKTFLEKLSELEQGHYLTLKNKLEEFKANNFSLKGILSSFDDITSKI